MGNKGGGKLEIKYYQRNFFYFVQFFHKIMTMSIFICNFVSFLRIWGGKYRTLDVFRKASFSIEPDTVKFPETPHESGHRKM